MIGKYLNILYINWKITNILRITVISKSWVMLRSRVGTTELTLRCERKTRKKRLRWGQFLASLFSSVQNLTFYRSKKNINVFSHRSMLKIELKKVFFMAWLAKPKSDGNDNHTVLELRSLILYFGPTQIELQKENFLAI